MHVNLDKSYDGDALRSTSIITDSTTRMIHSLTPEQLLVRQDSMVRIVGRAIGLVPSFARELLDRCRWSPMPPGNLPPPGGVVEHPAKRTQV